MVSPEPPRRRLRGKESGSRNGPRNTLDSFWRRDHQHSCPGRALCLPLELRGPASFLTFRLRASVQRHRRAQGCRSCSRCGRHRARRHCGNACGSARNVSSTVVTVRAPLFRQTKVSARSPCRSMTTSNSLRRLVRASVPFSVSIASRRTGQVGPWPGIGPGPRWAPDGGFGDRVGCIPPVRPMSQGYTT